MIKIKVYKLIQMKKVLVMKKSYYLLEGSFCFLLSDEDFICMEDSYSTFNGSSVF